MTITPSSSLTVRLKKPTKLSLIGLSKTTDRSMSYHTEKALNEYLEKEKQRVVLLREALNLGLSDLDAGKGIRMTKRTFKSIKERGRDRLSTLKS